MIVTGDGDTRVAPLHGRKMAALLQASTGSDAPVLLHYDTSAGHSGGLAVNKAVEKNVDLFSFLFGHLGVEVR
jgi:prolyl oligopeptidase